MKTLAETGECDLIQRIGRWIESAYGSTPLPALRLGVGDDCAVIQPSDPAQWDDLLTSDAVIEQVHFLPDADPAAIGHKAIGRCLSDLAAMGGEPRWALVNLVAPAATAVARIEAIMGGLLNTAAACGATVVGGDVAVGPGLEVHVFMVGRVPRGQAVSRHGARPGDGLFVTGKLGGSGAGRHLAFTPRLTQGAWLRAGGWVSAMIDLSDGLGIDARRLLGAGRVAGRINVDRLPVADAVSWISDLRSVLTQVLSDGEDYELLFCVKSDKTEAMVQAWNAAGFDVGCTRIGEVIAGPAGHLEGITDDGRMAPLDYGYEHFRSSQTTADPVAGGDARAGG